MKVCVFCTEPFGPDEPTVDLSLDHDGIVGPAHEGCAAQDAYDRDVERRLEERYLDDQSHNLLEVEHPAEVDA